MRLSQSTSALCYICHLDGAATVTVTGAVAGGAECGSGLSLMLGDPSPDVCWSDDGPVLVRCNC
jgi:hypothetical protein